MCATKCHDDVNSYVCENCTQVNILTVAYKHKHFNKIV